MTTDISLESGEIIPFKDISQLLFSGELDKTKLRDLYSKSIIFTIHRLVLILRKSQEDLIKYDAGTEKGLDSPNFLEDIGLFLQIYH